MEVIHRDFVISKIHFSKMDLDLQVNHSVEVELIESLVMEISEVKVIF